MLFVISGTTTPDVRRDRARLAKRMEAEIARHLSYSDFSSPVSSIVVFPTILNPSIASMPDSVTYNRNDNSVFAAINIPFSTWMEAPFSEQIDLLAENIRSSLEKIGEKYLKHSDRAKLIDFVEEARLALKDQYDGGITE